MKLDKQGEGLDRVANGVGEKLLTSWYSESPDCRSAKIKDSEKLQAIE